MRVDVALQVDVEALRVLAADARRAGGIIGPFAADHEIAVAEAHLGMDRLVVGIGDEHGRLETERLFQPGKGRQWIAVEQG